MFDPATFHATETLSDGRKVEIRAQRPEDRQGLRTAVGRKSPQSSYHRFLRSSASFPRRRPTSSSTSTSSTMSPWWRWRRGRAAGHRRRRPLYRHRARTRPKWRSRYRRLSGEGARHGAHAAHCGDRRRNGRRGVRGRSSLGQRADAQGVRAQRARPVDEARGPGRPRVDALPRTGGGSRCARKLPHFAHLTKVVSSVGSPVGL